MGCLGTPLSHGIPVSHEGLQGALECPCPTGSSSPIDFPILWGARGSPCSIGSPCMASLCPMESLHHTGFSVPWGAQDSLCPIGSPCPLDLCVIWGFPPLAVSRVPHVPVNPHIVLDPCVLWGSPSLGVPRFPLPPPVPSDPCVLWGSPSLVVPGQSHWIPLPCRAGVRHLHAEAPVHVREHQHPPGARRPHPEHLVPAAGNGAAGQVRGEDGGGGPPLSSPLCGGGHPIRCVPPSASGAGRRRWRRSRRCTQSTTRCSTAPAPSTARSST